MPKLRNIKHETFCQEYLVDLNATQAYIRTGYASKNANNCSSALLATPKIRARVDELLAARSVRVGVGQDRVLRELARIAFLDPTKLANMDNASVNDDATEDDRAAIASIKVKSGGETVEREIRFVDKLKALELMGKHLGMYTDKVDVKGSLNSEIKITIGGEEFNDQS